MASSITNENPHLGPPDDFTFLLGGHSWIEKRFYIWTIRYSVAVKGFIAVEAPTLACNGVARKGFTPAVSGWSRGRAMSWDRSRLRVTKAQKGLVVSSKC